MSIINLHPWKKSKLFLKFANILYKKWKSLNLITILNVRINILAIIKPLLIIINLQIYNLIEFI